MNTIPNQTSRTSESAPTPTSRRIELLRGWIAENRAILRRDHYTVESYRIARQNIEDAEKELLQLEAKQ